MMEFFCVNGVKMVKTREFTTFKSGETFERIDSYDQFDRKTASKLYSQKEIDRILTPKRK
jgi:hypothetical protein